MLPFLAGAVLEPPNPDFADVVAPTFMDGFGALVEALLTGFCGELLPPVLTAGDGLFGAILV